MLNNHNYSFFNLISKNIVYFCIVNDINNY